ncbi:MAG: hypothetical protein HDT42_02035 [Ruminococcaceae bacterium]|nr:hypothetical protein [Oscillospiraceae bacterium]
MVFKYRPIHFNPQFLGWCGLLLFQERKIFLRLIGKTRERILLCSERIQLLPFFFNFIPKMFNFSLDLSDRAEIVAIDDCELRRQEDLVLNEENNKRYSLASKMRPTVLDDIKRS